MESGGQNCSVLNVARDWQRVASHVDRFLLGCYLTHKYQIEELRVSCSVLSKMFIETCCNDTDTLKYLNILRRLLTDVNIHGGRRWSSSLHRNNKPRIISNITNSLLKTLKRMEDAPSVTPFMRKSLRAINVTQLKLENNVIRLSNSS